MSLYIKKHEDESEPALRRRTARALTELLERDDLLREEVAMILGIPGIDLDMSARKPPVLELEDLHKL